MTTTVLDVPINNDGICESNETFILTIDTFSLPDKAIHGDPSQTTVTILDDDSELLHEIYEHSSKYILCVILY